MDQESTHEVTVIVSGKYPHGDRQAVKVSVGGDGGVAHMVDTFRAAMIAAGFTIETASKFDCVE